MADREPLESRGESLPADSVVSLLRDFLGFVSNRGKEGIGRAQERGRSQLELRQLRRDRDKRLEKLGREVMALQAAGELDHPGLAAHMDHIHALDGRIAEARLAGASGGDLQEE
jgi:hypothetical protein